MKQKNHKVTKKNTLSEGFRDTGWKIINQCQREQTYGIIGT